MKEGRIEERKGGRDEGRKEGRKRKKGKEEDYYISDLDLPMNKGLIL
jgi:hypothetical protein